MLAFIERFEDTLVKSGLKILYALLILAVGFWLVGYIIKIVDRALTKSSIDISVHRFIKSGGSFFLKFIVIITALNVLGVPMATFIAMLSAAGLAIALSLRDSLSNFAAGIIILIFKPFGVGDYIESGDVSGTVVETQILYTVLNSLDMKRITIPNTDLVSSKLTNYSVNPLRGIRKTVPVSYESDVKKVKNILLEIVKRNKYVLKDKDIVIRLDSMEDSSIDFLIVCWTLREDYYIANYEMNEEILEEFAKENIEIPYNKQDIFLK